MFRPSLMPSLARLPSFKTAVTNSIGSNRIPMAAKTKQMWSSIFGGGVFAGHGNDRNAGKSEVF